MPDTLPFNSEFSRLLADPSAGEPGPQAFPWQRRLWESMLGGELPAALDIPTGLGKTAVMAIWLLARASGADVPRRLVYVVDRRVVVDQATEYAQRLRKNLPPALVEALGLPANGNLPISTLRGGFSDAGEWLANPASPAIVVGTVDMIGSRLLFEGYGVSRRMRPFHAGLLGTDTLFVLDEAHLNAPFQRLLEQFTGQRRSTRLGTPPTLMTLSATGLSPASGDVFTLDDDDHAHPVVAARTGAHKAMTLDVVPAANADLLAEEAVALAEATGPTARTVVYLASREMAAKVAAAIRKKTKPGKAATPPPVELLTGGRRGHERDIAALRLRALGFLADTNEPSDTAAYLVATAAGEVGIDLDADAMLCDLMPFERIVQRLGRVNRRGRSTAQVRVLNIAKVVAEDKKTAFDHRLDATQSLLERLPPLDGGGLDASPGALTTLRNAHPAQVVAATTPAPLHPALQRPTVEAWAMTSLKEHAGRPEVAPWLRGWQDDEVVTTVVWRRTLPLPTTSATAALDDYLADTPVHATEKLDLPTHLVTKWLFARFKVCQASDSPVGPQDVAAVVLAQDQERSGTWTATELATVGGGTDATRKRFERALSGSTLVVDQRLGGLSDGLLDNDGLAHVVAADDAPSDSRDGGFRTADVDRPTIRWAVSDWNNDTDPVPPAFFELDPSQWLWVRRYATHNNEDGAPLRGIDVWRWRQSPTSETSRAYGGRAQSLAEHASWTLEEATAIADALALEPWLHDAVTTAAWRHDAGKDCERWQVAMNAPATGRPYAKTAGGGNPHALAGYRHEFGSLIEAEGAELPEQSRELILHLIAAHHGNARPALSPEGAPHLPPSALAPKALEVALRFEALQHQHDPWGLAWVEALVRAADQRASARLEQQADG